MRTYSVLSLFSGCGGLDLGFMGGFQYLNNYYKKNNFNIVWANDIDKNACITYKHNFKHNIVCADIRDILQESTEILDETMLPKKVDIVLGGFPCQDFSHAGKRRGFNSTRGTLYKAMCDVIKKTAPEIFVAENVKGLLTMNDGEAIKTIISDFRELGYNVSYELLIASNFQVPQKRERVIIIGTKKRSLPMFSFSHLKQNISIPISLEEAIGDLEHVEEGKFNNHYWSKAKKNKGQGNNAVIKNQPGPTMRSEHHGNIEFHWNETRRLSAREAARIQSFPDNFVFLPSTSAAYKQIGNAVPPILGWHLANAIEKFLEENSKNFASIVDTNGEKIKQYDCNSR